MFKKLKIKLKRFQKRFYKLRRTKREIIGFTLIELVVVSVVLSIFLILAAMLFNGLIKDTRDSARVTELRQINKNLETFQSERGKYPEPQDSIGVNFSGSLLWAQGSFGESTMRIIGTMNKKPVDTLSKNEFTYSLSNNKSEYQLGVIVEGDVEITSNLLPRTYAGDRKARSYIAGNYNSLVSSVCSGDDVYILSIPSIIANDLSDIDIETIISKKNLVYKGYHNLPETYKDTIFDIYGGFDFAPSSLVVYAGSKRNLAISETLKVTLLKNLQNTYRGTILEDKSPFKELVAKDSDSVNENLILFIDKFLKENVCGDILTVGATSKGGTTKVSPTCGVENGASYNFSDSSWSSSNFCGIGTLNPANPTFPAAGGSTSWQCENTGIIVDCSANRSTIVPPVCGAEDGTTYNYNESTWASSDFCSTGTGNPVSPTFPIEGATTSWQCDNDGASVNCSADRLTAVSPVCGTEDGLTYNYNDSSWSTSDFCGTGISTPVNPAFPIQGATSSWQCDSDGDSVNCSANRIAPVLPVCGSFDGNTYSWNDTTWGAGTFCDTGASSPVSPSFPTQGDSSPWQCFNDGEMENCSADRLDPPFTSAPFVEDSRFIAEDGDNKIWIASKNGVGVLSGGTLETTYNESDGLADKETRSIIVDSSGNYWIATLKGVSFFDGTNWITYNKDELITSNDTVSLHEDTAGNIWVATNKGVSVFDGTTWISYDEGDGLIDKEVNCITQTLDGNMWFGTQLGASSFDNTNWTDYTISNGLPDNEVLSCYSDDLGNVWFGTKDGVGSFDGSNWITYNESDGLANKFVNTILKDSNGNMWFGTHAGLSLFDGSLWITYTTADGLTDNEIQYLFQDSTGTIWVATKNGVSTY